MFRRVLFLLALFLVPLQVRLFALQDAFELDPIVISKKLAHPFVVYSRDSGQIVHLGSLPVDLQSRSPQHDIQTDFSLRGSSFQGVLMLLNGRRINDPQTAHHNGDIPLTKEDIERIDVMPGAGSSLFGPDAIGGAINIIPKKPDGRKVVLEAGGGQYGTSSGLLSISEKFDSAAVRLSLQNEESSGFSEGRDFKKFTAAFTSALDLAAAEVSLNAGYQEKEFGAYDFYTPASGYASQEWTKTYLISTDCKLAGDGFTFKPGFLWRRHEDKFLLDKTLARSRYLNHHRTDMYTPSLYFQKDAGALGNIGLGLEYSEERINSVNLGKHSRSQKSLYLDESKSISDALSGGISFRLDDSNTFGEVYTGSASLKYRLDDASSVSVGVSRNMRIPSFTELYYTDPTTVGDAGLLPEKALNYQLGYDHKNGSFSFGAVVFYRKEEDLIDWIKRTRSQARWQVENITKAGVSGLEQYLNLKLTEWLELASNYSYVDKRIYDQGYLYKYGPNYTKHLFNNVLTFRLPFGVQTIGLTYKKKPGRDGWLLMNLGLSRNLTPHATVFLNASNFLNVEYQEIEGIAQPGRWVEAGLRLEW